MSNRGSPINNEMAKKRRRPILSGIPSRRRELGKPLGKKDLPGIEERKDASLIGSLNQKAKSAIFHGSMGVIPSQKLGPRCVW
jgi:hypothetical protein